MTTSLKDLYFEQLKDLYDAEYRLVEALPKMMDAASSKELQRGLNKHLEETKGHVTRLKSIFETHGMKAERESCKAMQGLIAEGEKEISEWKASPEVKDAAIIASAQRVEHYEMAGYGTARCYAEMLGFVEDVDVLTETLEEERSADTALNDIALSSVNRDALMVPSHSKSHQGGARA
ncbi:MAG TPA: ferritin-like domain-containing protein [Bdellovibrionota bacterium]|jgi:ferritin-like metal-binding protein YciE|nr:ferritin-like domain-containing protein [Bdellovibrionota bacterium]